MQGQHIFARCWNEQGNAGTWTAAVTDSLVSRDTIRNVIEPRCNIDETLAQKYLARHPGSNILRVYHLPEKTVVVSRTFWEADKITDSSSRGRMGAYSFSHILSGDDSLQFCRDYAGAFDSNCFETYNNLVNRTGAVHKKPITIATDYSLFNHGEVIAKADTLEKIGLTKSSFIKLMSGIYFAIEKKKQFAVVLPKSVRKAWEEFDSNQMELAICNLMGLLPDFTRENFNFTAHWNDNLTNQMVNEMHLIFIHADEQEAIARLQREGFSVLDVETETVSDEVPMVADDYFAFLWENKENIPKIEEFWSYAKSYYAKLLRVVPNSALAIQCIYLIKETIDSEYKNAEISAKAFELAAELFAGAGKKIPAANQFIHDVILHLNITAESITPRMEKSLRNLIQKDKEPTAHQEQEYEILLSSCAKGKLSLDTIGILCDELLKDSREADMHFARFLLVHENDSILNSTQSMVLFLVGVFHKLFCTPNCDSRNPAIQASIFTIMKNWAEELVSYPNHFALDFVVNSFADYLSAGGNDEQMVAESYDFFFQEEIAAPEAISNKCADIIFKEEKKLYHGRELLNTGVSALHVFFQAFSSCFKDCDKRNKKIAEDYYERLYRLLFYKDEFVSEKAKELYQVKVEDSLAIPLQIHAIQNIELAVLEDVKKAPSIWQDEKVRADVIDIEKINLSSEEYKPNKERIANIAQYFDCHQLDSLEIVLEYAKRLSSDERYQLYGQLKNSGQINNLYCAAFFSDDFASYLREIASFIEMSFREIADTLLESQVEGISLNDTESIKKFANWFVLEIDKEFDRLQCENWALFLSKCFGLIRDYDSYIKAKAQENKELVYAVLYKLNSKMMSLLNEVPLGEFSRVKRSDLKDICKLLDKKSEVEIQNSEIVSRVANTLCKLDECDKQNSGIDSPAFKTLCNICYNTISSDYSEIVIGRLKYLYEQHSEKYPWIELYLVFAELMSGNASNFNRANFKKHSCYNSYNDRQKITFWAVIIRQLKEADSKFEGIIVQTYLDERHEIFEKNKRLLEDKYVIDANYSLYKSNQTMQQLLKQQPEKKLPIDRSRRVSMEIPPISWNPLLAVLCAIVGIVSAFAAIGAWLLLAPVSGMSNTIIMIMGTIVALILFIVGLFIY